jgi:hypothetical protein
MLLKIKKLEVTLIRPTGEVQESGVAVKSGFLWKYVSSTDNPSVSGTEVRALAYDRFGKSDVKFVRMV